MFKKLLLIIAFTQYIFGVDATMEIIKKKINLPVISVVLSLDTNKGRKLPFDLLSLIKKDLAVSGHFENSPFSIESSFSQTPRYTILRQNDIDLYLVVQVQTKHDNSLIVNVRLYDVNTSQFVLSKSYTTTSSTRYPFLAHKISIDINKYLDAPSIEWMDKFVIFSRYLNSRSSEIVISDYTLTYQKVVVKNGLNIFPKWADKSQENFYYTSYEYGKPTLVKQNLYTAKKSKILSSEGMIVCSDVSKDGSKLVLTMAPNDQPDIYVYDLNSKIKTRVTNYSGIDVGGSFVDDDKRIVFISDRLKYPNIFAKGINSKGTERLIYHGKNNSQCTTYNNYIAYSSRETENEFGRNTFNLYLISTTSDYLRRLTTNGRNQFPKFSRDGESLLFIKNDSADSYLGVIRLNYNKSFLFKLKSGKLQSIDW